ncbi:uncharacterized protein LOC125579812 [Brassica napus]|uniref:uncharacterized protein LOC125579812 n=1 Tax=Brassica napus TaxID=3708 RepID=UPI0020791A4B|nr:uncharacterized protein LOC125579812 [Brassica napus]
MRPPVSAPPPEAHATEDNKESHHVQGNGHHGRGRGKWNGCGRGRSSFGRGRGNQHGRDHGRDRGSFGRGHGRGRGSSFKPQHSTNSSKSVCHRCEMNENKDVLVVDSGSSHTILKDKRYFINLTLKNVNISTIAGIASLIEGHGQANIMLPMGTHLEISDALYSPNSKRTLLSFQDI